MTLLASSFLIWVSLNETALISLTSGGQRSGRMVPLSCLPQFTTFSRELTQFRKCLTVTFRLNRTLNFIALQKENVVFLLERTCIDKPLAQFKRHGTKDRPGKTKVEGDFLADVIVFQASHNLNRNCQYSRPESTSEISLSFCARMAAVFSPWFFGL